MLTTVGWDSDDAWGASLSLDRLLVAEIKHAAKVVPEGVIRDAVAARRTLEPDSPILLCHRAAINGYLKPASSRISISIGIGSSARPTRPTQRNPCASRLPISRRAPT
jgi:hypothetical protein